jgi:hypothetical protein
MEAGILGALDPYLDTMPYENTLANENGTCFGITIVTLQWLKTKKE